MTGPILPIGVTVRQARRARFHQLVGGQPAFIRVAQGRKAILGGEAPIVIDAGDHVLLPDGLPVTIENIVGPGGYYEARVVPVHRDVFERAYQKMEAVTRPAQPVCVPVRGLPAEAAALFDGFFDAALLAGLPPAVFELRLEELVAWFAASGAVLNRAAAEPLAARLRRLVMREPARPWTAELAASAFHMSEPTLRRRLAAEATRFSDIVRDVRLTHGLALLQTTALPVGRVAVEAGYESPSQFSARFRERFGLLPRDIRDGTAAFDRIGA